MTSLVLILVGCSAHIHKIGQGAQGNNIIEERQWYVLWGLVPINDVQTDQMTSAADYTIKTEQSALDVIINIFTSVITVYSRTVTVTE
jgi:hypothetical protein